MLVLSLGGEVAHDLVGTSNTLVGGAVLSLFAIVSGATSLVGRSIPARLAMMLGALISAAGMGLLALAVDLGAAAIAVLSLATLLLAASGQAPAAR